MGSLDWSVQVGAYTVQQHQTGKSYFTMGSLDWSVQVSAYTVQQHQTGKSCYWFVSCND